MKPYTLALSTFCRNEDTIYISIHVQDADTLVLDLKILYTGIVYFLQMKISFMSRSFIDSASIPCIYIQAWKDFE